jgi:hypothetical protein
MFAIPNTKIFLDMDIPTVPENSWNFWVFNNKVSAK